jgi:hypothetical protein
MDWFDDVVLVATEGPKFTKAEIVANEVTRYVSEPSSLNIFSLGNEDAGIAKYFLAKRLMIE